VVVIIAGWCAYGWLRRADRTWWRATGIAASVPALLLTLWFGWSLLTFGLHGTFLTNSSVTSSDARQGNQLVKMTLNLVDTLVPHFARSLDTSLIAQRSPWGALRDWFFQCYQVNLPLAFGCGAWLAILYELRRMASSVSRSARAFWISFIIGIILLGTATHGQRDHWGLAHICLQALVIAGISFLAARWATLSKGWRLTLTFAAGFDFVAGILLHFGVQSLQFDRWFGPKGSLDELLASMSPAGQMNLVAKITHRVAFFADVTALPLALTMAALALVFTVAVLKARAAR
jgi:hypothetical protein